MLHIYLFSYVGNGGPKIVLLHLLRIVLLPIEAFTYFRCLSIFQIAFRLKVCHITLHMVVFVFVVYAQGPLAYCIEINFILSYLTTFGQIDRNTVVVLIKYAYLNVFIIIIFYSIYRNVYTLINC